MTAAEQVDHIRRQMVGLKPRSKRMIELGALLRQAKTKQLRAEVRAQKRRMA